MDKNRILGSRYFCFVFSVVPFYVVLPSCFVRADGVYNVSQRSGLPYSCAVRFEVLLPLSLSFLAQLSSMSLLYVLSDEAESYAALSATAIRLKGGALYWEREEKTK